MSKEEKEAIEILLFKRKGFEFNQAGYNHHLSFTITECKEVLDPVLNLIEKQNKVIDKMAEDLAENPISKEKIEFIKNSYFKEIENE